VSAVQHQARSCASASSSKVPASSCKRTLPRNGRWVNRALHPRLRTKVTQTTGVGILRRFNPKLSCRISGRSVILKGTRLRHNGHKRPRDRVCQTSGKTFQHVRISRPPLSRNDSNASVSGMRKPSARSVIRR